MRLLRHDELPEVPLERVFKHSVLGGFVMLFVLGAPAVLGAAYFRHFSASFERLPWFFWLVGGPMMLIGLLLWLLVLQAAKSSIQSSLLPTNWVLRVSAAGIGVQLRSYRNSHFRKDVATVLWLDPGEVARARRVIESGWVQSAKGKTLVRASWLELELQGVDCAPIEKRLAEERAEQGPEIRVLGIRTRTRFNEMPAYFVRPGVLRVQWLGKGMLEALREQVEVAPDAKIDLEQALGTELEPRVKALCARGLNIAAYELLRNERGLSLADAKRFVEDVERKAA